QIFTSDCRRHTQSRSRTPACTSSVQLPQVERSYLLFDPAAEDLHVSVLLAALRADEEIGALRAQDKVNRYDQPPRAQVVVGQQIVRKQHARAFACRIECVIGAVEAQPARDIDAVDAGCLEPFSPG